MIINKIFFVINLKKNTYPFDYNLETNVPTSFVFFNNYCYLL